MTSEPAPRRLVLLRHGKSAYPAGVPDHGRPLAPRGVREAGLAGDWIRAHLPAIDRVLCSTAERARQTLAAAGIDAPTSFADEIYGAYPDELLALVSQQRGRDRTVLIVGHAPGLPDLAEELAGAGSDGEALARVRTKFPTSAVAIVQVGADWASIDSAETRLTHCVVPRAGRPAS